MKIIRYHNSPGFSPAASYPTLRDEMDRLFDVAFPPLNSPRNNRFFGDFQGEFPIDLYQSKDAFTVRAELPGFRKEEVGVEVADGLLTLTAHQKAVAPSDNKDEPVGKAVPERRLDRAIALPKDVDVDKIQAQYENGVLTLTLPKREEIKPRQISVEVK
jgi:HSP20 family protein